ncbi:hypothetical protein ABNQ39_22110 [Azospirillum sp. A26]
MSTDPEEAHLYQFGDLISGQIGLTGNRSEQAVGDSGEASRPFQGFGIGHRADGSHDVGAATEPGPKIGRNATDEIIPPTEGAKKAVLGVRGHGHTTFRHVHSGSAQGGKPSPATVTGYVPDFPPVRAEIW